MLFFCVSVNLFAQEKISAEQAEKIYRLGGLEQCEKNIASSIEKVIKKQKGEIAEEDYQLLEKAGQIAFQTDSVHNTFIASLQEIIKVNEYQVIEKWYSSPLAVKMNELEKNAEEADFLSDDEISGKRKKIINRLIAKMQPAETLIDMIFPPTIAIMKATRPSDVVTSDEDMQKVMKPMAKMMRGMMEMAMMGQYAGIYKEVSDKELNEYVRFYESKSGIALTQNIKRTCSVTMENRLNALLELLNKLKENSHDVKKL